MLAQIANTRFGNRKNAPVFAPALLQHCTREGGFRLQLDQVRRGVGHVIAQRTQVQALLLRLEFVQQFAQTVNRRAVQHGVGREAFGKDLVGYDVYHLSCYYCRSHGPAKFSVVKFRKTRPPIGPRPGAPRFAA